MKLSDMTYEQSVIIGKLAFGGDLATPDITSKYDDGVNGGWDVKIPLMRVLLRGYVFGNTDFNIVVEVQTDLNVWLWYEDYLGLHRLPTRNQHLTQKKLMEWGIEHVA